MNNNTMKNNIPVVNETELKLFIIQMTGIKLKTIQQVLNAEYDYFKKIGLVEENKDDKYSLFKGGLF